MSKPPATPALVSGAAASAAPRRLLAGLALAMLLPALDTSIANVALPTLAAAFRAPFHAVQWIVLAYLLATTVFLVGAGRLGDVVGRRRLLRTGIVLFTVASALCGLAPSLATLLAARVLQGLAAAILMALTLAVAGEAVPRERLGRAVGLLGAMSAVGTTLGPALGGLLLAAVGWRSIFLVNLPLGLVALALTRGGGAPEPARPPRGAGFDVAGTGLLALTLAAYALALTQGEGGLGRGSVALLAAALGGAGLFTVVEARAAAPLLALDMLRDRRRRAGLALAALVSAVVMATLVVGPFYLGRGLGLGTALAGAVLSAGPLVAALTGFPAGKLVDRFGAARLARAGLATMTVACAVLASAAGALGLAGYLAPLVMLTAGYALFQAANNTALLAGASDDQRGVVAGLLSLARNLGLITGTSLLGAVFAFGARAGDVARASAEQAASGMRWTFAVAGAGLLLGALALRGGVDQAADRPTRSRRRRAANAIVQAVTAATKNGGAIDASGG